MEQEQKHHIQQSQSFQEPNTQFLENYHSLKDHQGLTKLDRSPFLVVRHALS